MDEHTSNCDVCHRFRICRRIWLFGQLTLFETPFLSLCSFPFVPISHCVCLCVCVYTCTCVSFTRFLVQAVLFIASLPSWLSLGLVMIWYLLKFIMTVYKLAHSQVPLSKSVRLCVCVCVCLCVCLRVCVCIYIQ